MITMNDAYEERMRQTKARRMPDTNSLEARLQRIDNEFSACPTLELLKARLAVLAELMAARPQ